jgi:hypothetical protein
MTKTSDEMKAQAAEIRELIERVENAAKTAYEERREALAEILKTVEAEGLKGPRDLDVALDAIEGWFKEDSKP